MKKNKKIRPLGQITTDLEKLLYELHIDHDLQHGEVLYLINGWQHIHVPQQIETYTKDKTHPVLYGPKPRRSMIEISKDIKKNRRKK